MKINVSEYALMDGVYIHKYLNEDNFNVPLNYDRPVMDSVAIWEQSVVDKFSCKLLTCYFILLICCYFVVNKITWS